MGVETEPGAVELDEPIRIGRTSGERITPGLPLEAQGVQQILHIRQSPGG